MCYQREFISKTQKIIIIIEKRHLPPEKHISFPSSRRPSLPGAGCSTALPLPGTHRAPGGKPQHPHPALHSHWTSPGAPSRAPHRTAATDTSMLLLVLHNNFITVIDALGFLETLANPSGKPFSSLGLQAAAFPPAFHPLLVSSSRSDGGVPGETGTFRLPRGARSPGERRVGSLHPCPERVYVQKGCCAETTQPAWAGEPEH